MRKKKWKDKDKAEFLKRLGTLLAQGYPLAEGIELLTVYKPQHVKDALRSIVLKLRSGTTLHQALEAEKFPQDVLLYLYFAEQNGDTSTGLIESGELFSKRVDMIKKITGLLRYPVILLWVVSMLTLVMVNYLFPHFQNIFSVMAMEPPLITKLFLSFIDFVPFIFWGGSAFVTLFLCYYFFIFRKYSPHEKVRILQKIPGVSTFTESLITYYFSSQLSSLLKGGISILHALSIFEGQNYIRFFKDEAKSVKEQLQEGYSLDGVIAQRSYYQADMSLIIKQGQSRGRLASELRHYSDMLFSSIEENVKKTVMTIQPICFLLIGSVVLLMFLSILLPIFGLINSMG
ncbi:competence type IV pilus assembly protein ComGB [Alkalihalobacillus sp. LMS39]|uniref:competence type IV pilus assembly protein ComGB n=1 Tax=Alkalihalobacillus sp. LMS39 TaxID=2924032 RepID=UPI001FB33B9B|nr:competence type IV pilus assembly protein ComGB [Alkalihalobacillus sp. LMS39]UOE95877.1 type II secretion system F family protein [Alkalihalobacillus sp. LMS39]